MKFFRDDKRLDELTVDDRVEVFRIILTGSSDLTKGLLTDILVDYSVTNLEVINIGNGEK